MQKRSHKLLASALLRSCGGFSSRRYEWAFLLGSVQPDCNPLTYLKGSLRGRFLRGHDFSNSRNYIFRRISSLQKQPDWTARHYYTLGKLTHYLADAFTYPHNPQMPRPAINHHAYERQLRSILHRHLASFPIPEHSAPTDLIGTLNRLHQQYAAVPSCIERDIGYILRATALLLTLFPASNKSHTYV